MATATASKAERIPLAGGEYKTLSALEKNEKNEKNGTANAMGLNSASLRKLEKLGHIEVVKETKAVRGKGMTIQLVKLKRHTSDFIERGRTTDPNKPKRTPRATLAGSSARTGEYVSISNLEALLADLKAAISTQMGQREKDASQAIAEARKAVADAQDDVTADRAATELKRLIREKQQLVDVVTREVARSMKRTVDAKMEPILDLMMVEPASREA